MAQVAQYNVQIQPHGDSAKNKGIASSVPLNYKEKKEFFYFFFELPENHDPMAYLQKAFWKDDTRPISGRSYVKPLRVYTTSPFQVGMKVRLNAPFIGMCAQYDADGNPRKFRQGVINEVIDRDRICVTLKGYPNPFVDFSRHEVLTII